MTKITLACPECGLRFVAHHHRAMFCTPAHQKAYNRRAEREGQEVIALAKAWRAARSSKDPAIRDGGKLAFSRLCSVVDASNSRDRDANRAHPTLVFVRRRAANMLDW